MEGMKTRSTFLYPPVRYSVRLDTGSIEERFSIGVNQVVVNNPFA